MKAMTNTNKVLKVESYDYSKRLEVICSVGHMDGETFIKEIDGTLHGDVDESDLTTYEAQKFVFNEDDAAAIAASETKEDDIYALISSKLMPLEDLS